MKKIIYTRPDGGLSVTTPVQGARLANKVLQAFGVVFATVSGPTAVERISRKWKLFFGVEWAETEDEFIERIWQKDVPADAINVQITDAALIPTDRTFRNAWKADLTVDMPKAREIWRNKFREIRAPLFVANDLAIRDAQIDGVAVKLAAAVARRNALRDAPADPAIESASTPEELKAVMPEVLR